MATLGNTPRPSYVYDQETDTWVPIGVAPHSHDYTTQFIGKTLVDAKGDIVTASASDTPAILSKGADGTVLVADSTTSTGLAWQPYGAIQVAGKNKFINGDFSVWQRGTSFTNPENNSYNCDRYRANGNGTGVTKIISRQAFTPGTAPVSGYESQYFYRFAQTVAGTGATYNNGIQQPIEDVRTFAGQTVTWSFWAKADSIRTIYPNVEKFYGSGGTGYEYINLGGLTLSTTWTRYSITFAAPSISGKTLGAGSYFMPYLAFDNNTVQTFDFWGWQIEAGSTATPFTTATGTIQGELAACQRYYQRYSADVLFGDLGFNGKATTTTVIAASRTPYIQFRTTPALVDFSNVTYIVGWGGATTGITNITIAPFATKDAPLLYFTTTGLTAGSNYIILGSNNTAGYIGLSAEL